MKNLSLLIAFCCYMLFSATVLAQKTTPNFIYDAGGKIDEMMITESGILVATTSNGLVCVKPNKSDLHFKFTDFGKIKPEEYYFVPNSPYVVLAQGRFMSSKKAVLDYVSGKVLFNSTTDDWKQIYSETIAIPQNKLIVSGLQKSGGMAENNTPKIAVYDLATGKLDFSFFMFKPGKVTSANWSVTGEVLLLKDRMLIPTSRGIVAKTFKGDDIWENNVKNVNWMVADESEKEIYGFQLSTSGKNTEIFKINPTSGAEIWAKAPKVQGSVSNFEILPQGLAIVSNKSSGGASGLNKLMAQNDESEIGFISAQTGADLWEKAPKTKGYVQHFYVMDDGILFGIQQGGINKISYDGKPLFKKPLSTGENIHTMAETPQGLIYITDEDANIVNLNTGETIWKKALKYKKSNGVQSTYDSKNNRYLIATDSEAFAIDENTGDVAGFVTLDFKEKEGPTSMEVREGGIFIGSSQNMFKYAFNGDEIYNSYFKSPGISTFGKIAMGVLAVATTAMAAHQAAVAGANKNTLGQYNDYGAQANRNADMFASIGSASFNEMAKRFRATTETRDSQFILTKTDNGVGLVKVNKDTGNVEKEVVLNDKKPVYEVDEIEGILYYINKNNIEAYSLNQ
ncbi:MAG: PQQ-binding-like beta-propeller repeat protein [Flavobacteriaceae bacterium]|nr:PQQ-binding-like beta-propeller repeat protein [Flavobacteriaceae bacterium]